MPSKSPVLKLIYHNPVFGPIDLEYEQPVIRVGRNEDNDLVLRHHSVEPYHCKLLFRAEKLVWLLPNQAISAETDLRSLAGPEFGAGDQLQIGGLLFNVERSSRSVGIPAVGSPSTSARTAAMELAAAAEEIHAQYLCPRCQIEYQRSELKRVGLVGHPKRWLCPKCSHVFEVEPEAPKPVRSQPPPPPKRWLLRRSVPTPPSPTSAKP